MPTAFGPVTLMASVNTPPDLPTVIAPEADRASTPLVTAVIVPPVAATSTVPAPPALTRMPSPPECTSASVVIETFPSSPPLVEALTPAVVGVSVAPIAPLASMVMSPFAVPPDPLARMP